MYKSQVHKKKNSEKGRERRGKKNKGKEEGDLDPRRPKERGGRKT